MTHTKQDSRCSALTKKGKPCRAAATEGGLCFFHANPKKAAELGRIGGRKNGRKVGVLDPLPDLDSVSAVRDAVKRMIAEVYAGKLHPRTAAGLAPLLNLQLRAIEKTDLEGRLAKIENQLNELRAQRAQDEQASKRSGTMGKRPAQAVKPYSSDDSKFFDQS